MDGNYWIAETTSMKADRRKRISLSGESGQAAVEFALIATALVVMLTVPFDLFRYADAEMTLNSAATEAVTQISADNLTESAALAAAQGMYADRLDDLAVTQFTVSGVETEHEYTYRVYSSDLESEPNFSNKFEARDSNYHCTNVQLQLSASWHAVTPLGSLFLGGDDISITSDVVTRDVYTGGYRE